MTPALSLQRAMILVAVSFGLMVATVGVFILALPPHGTPDTPLFSVALSLVAVLLPTLVASYWPRQGAPGGLPPYRPVHPWVLAGTALCSLPLYALFAWLQLFIGRHLALPSVAAATPGAFDLQTFLWVWLAIALLPAFVEEMMYRGMIQTSAIQAWGLFGGIFGASALFSLIHMEPAGFLSRILMGLWFGFLFWRSGSLWTCTLAHALNNSWGVVFGAWHLAIGAHIPAVWLLAILGVIGGSVCFYRAGYVPGFAAPRTDNAPDEMPRFVQISQPGQPKKP